MSNNANEIDYKYVIGIDPGGTTGIAMLRYTDDTLPELVYLHQQKGGMEGYWWFFGGSEIKEENTIVSEKWIERNIPGADRTPLLIEGIQYALWQDTVAYQPPAYKSLIPDEWLKEQNLWVEGKRHEMDALIHALVWLRNSGHEPTIEQLEGTGDEDEDGQPQEGAGGSTTIAQPGEAESKELTESELEDGAGNTDADEPDTNGDYRDGHYSPTDGYDVKDEEYDQTGKKRELNGVFAGFNPKDKAVRTLLDD